MPARTDGERAALSRQTRFELLRTRRRREVLGHLFETGESSDLRDLSEVIAARENGVDRADVTYDQRTRVYTTLRQNHLPKLDEADVVDFDPRSGAVSLGPAAAELRPYLELDPSGGSDRRARTAVVAAAALLVLAVFADLAPVTALPDRVWLVVVTLALAGTTLVGDG
jgi:hypothetical protein